MTVVVRIYGYHVFQHSKHDISQMNCPNVFIYFLINFNNFIICIRKAVLCKSFTVSIPIFAEILLTGREIPNELFFSKFSPQRVIISTNKNVYFRKLLCYISIYNYDRQKKYNSSQHFS